MFVLLSSFVISSFNSISPFVSGAPDKIVSADDFGYYGGSWSIVNLLLGVFSLILAIMAVCAFLKIQKKYKVSWGELVSVLVMGIISIMLFLLTEDMSRPMFWMDNLTIVHVILFVVELVVIVWVFVSTKKRTHRLELEQSKQRLAALSVAYVNGEVSEDAFVATSKKLEAKIASLEARKTRSKNNSS
jgi:hypothetical protein